MHGCFQLIRFDAEKVGIDIGIEHYGILLDHRGQHLDLITQSCCLFKLKFSTCFFHFASELRDIRFADATGQHADELFAHFPVFRCTDAPDARC